MAKTRMTRPRKVWQQLGRDDVEVARCTVERLMRGVNYSCRQI